MNDMEKCGCSCGATLSADLDIIAKGDRGYSAYEEAVLYEGFKGTRKDFLESLRAVAYQRYGSRFEFPNIGDVSVLYVDTTANKTYRWDNEGKKYYCVGSDYEDIIAIDCGNNFEKENGGH